MDNRVKFTTEFKRTVCEFYSNHTWKETAKHFDLPENSTTQHTISLWYRKLGFLPKSAGRNPNPDRVQQPKPTKSKLNFIVRRGGYIMNGKFYGNVEFAKIQRKLKMGDKFTQVTVTEHKVGILQA